VFFSFGVSIFSFHECFGLLVGRLEEHLALSKSMPRFSSVTGWKKGGPCYPILCGKGH